MSNGIIDSIFETLQNHPSVAAGTCTFAVAFALVAGNAFYAQSGNHPDPIWATRDMQTTQSIVPEARPVKVTAYAAKQPAGSKARKTTVGKPDPSPLVASLQDALKNTGDFDGSVDGLIGPVTRAAIGNYQARHNLEKTGEPSKALLDKILRDTPTIASSNKADPMSALIEKGASSNGPSSGYDRNLVRKIQLGIVNAGIAAIDADGIYGSKTEAAIIDFQRRNKLKVTGKPDAKLLEKLVILGLV